jgi:hypothetical protein
VRRTLAFATLGASSFLVLFSTWAGCGGGGGNTGGSGGGTTSTTSTSVSVGTGGSSTCKYPDGKCELAMGEDCTCEDCKDTAFCNPDQCLDTDKCDRLYDSCICPGCANDGFCGDPAKNNCTDDGTCDSYNEGCHCPDCWDKPACAPRVMACAGGKPDGICDRATEDCTCVDCEGTPLCVPCSVDGHCGEEDPCACSDCFGQSLCADPNHCVNDGVCATISEGCICDDCKDLPECQALLDGGAPDASDVDAGDQDAGADAGDAGP